jgi:hypothetical protein
METISALWKAMQIGAEIDNPALWKNRQEFGNKLGALILALIPLLKLVHVDVSQYVDTQTALIFGGFIATVWNIVLTRATSKKIGFGVPPEPAPVVQDGQPEQPAAKPTQDAGNNDDLYRGGN